MKIDYLICVAAFFVILAILLTNCASPSRNETWLYKTIPMELKK